MVISDPLWPIFYHNHNQTQWAGEYHPELAKTTDSHFREDNESYLPTVWPIFGFFSNGKHISRGLANRSAYQILANFERSSEINRCSLFATLVHCAEEENSLYAWST